MLAELKDNLLKAGKSEGCISFTELNKLLPDEIKDPTAIEKVFNFLGANNIEVVTLEEKTGEKRTLSGEVWKMPEKSSEDDTSAQVSPAPDDEPHDGEETTTTYLREMGRFDLLTPEEEAKYSKSIRHGFDSIIEAIWIYKS